MIDRHGGTIGRTHTAREVRKTEGIMWWAREGAA